MVLSDRRRIGGGITELYCESVTYERLPELTRRPGWAGDDNALHTYGLRSKVRRVGWATLTKRKWIFC